MNFKITYNWLKEFLDTDAAPDEIRKYLSLCGPSVEAVTKVGDDYVFDIEITSNRVDTASVIGIAQEASAILPEFGKKARLLQKPATQPLRLSGGASELTKLKLKVEDPFHLTSRLFAVVMEVKVGTLPQYMRARLEACDVRSLNNLIDITNYIMLEIGHPTHVFDYDRVKTGRLLIRNAKGGETVVTLDDKKYSLQPTDVVIDDGTGRIVDLPGIMGTSNSVITSKTKKIIFFIESNNPSVIRRTSMRLGIRTIAATINEKSPDPERAKQAFFAGIMMFEKYAGGKIISEVFDSNPDQKAPNTIKVSSQFINERIGVDIKPNKVLDMLKRLGFEVKGDNKNFTVTPPTFRATDVVIPEDIVEEVARIYGYHNLPNVIQPTVYIKQPKDTESFFILQSKIKHFLKHLGLNEVLNYSMISKKMITDFDLVDLPHIKLKNTISTEIEYMRRHIMGSLIMNIRENEGRKEILRFFEIAKTYKPVHGELPVEEYKLGIAVNTNWRDLKGIIDALFSELNIYDENLKKSNHPLLKNFEQSDFLIGKDWLGQFGTLKSLYKARIGLTSDVYVAVFDFNKLLKYSHDLPIYRPINHYATIKLDLTLKQQPKVTYSQLCKIAYETSPHLANIELLSHYLDKITLRFFFASDRKNLTEDEAKEELEKIKLKLNVL